ncbi:hypothetical protein G6F32_015805 [Rhizopus arrhizus]|nr:hypothetical protein G6F32_015805 [Rhizopus arrhizus]
MLVVGGDATGDLQDILPFAGQTHHAGAALEEFRPHVFFDFLEQLAERRLSDVQHFSGLVKAQGLGQQHEGPQLSRRQIHSFCLSITFGLELNAPAAWP